MLREIQSPVAAESEQKKLKCLGRRRWRTPGFFFWGFLPCLRNRVVWRFITRSRCVTARNESSSAHTDTHAPCNTDRDGNSNRDTPGEAVKKEPSETGMRRRAMLRYGPTWAEITRRAPAAEFRGRRHRWPAALSPRDKLVRSSPRTAVGRSGRRHQAKREVRGVWMKRRKDRPLEGLFKKEKKSSIRHINGLKVFEEWLFKAFFFAEMRR